MSTLRGVLLAGRFRSHYELNRMSNEDQRNTLIVELTARSNERDYQSFDDATLAGMGAVFVFLRESRIRDDAALRTMSADDQRNTLIVEINGQNPHVPIGELQGLTNMDLVRFGLGGEDEGRSLRQPSYLRGVLLAGRFRSQRELNAMSPDDHRNTLIVELSAHSNQATYQSFDDHTLAGMGAVMVALREAGIRDSAALQTMSADDQRNTLIVEINGQNPQLSIAQLQGLTSLDLVRLLLGADAAPMLRGLPGPLQPVPPPPRRHLQFRLRDFVQFRSTDSFLQGARDEVYISAMAVDSSRAVTFTNGIPSVAWVQGPTVGDVGDDSVRGLLRANPLVLFEFDLDDPGPLPVFEAGTDRRSALSRVFTVVLLAIEEDNAAVGDLFDEVKGKLQDKVNEAVRSAATAVSSAAATTTGTVVGTIVGAAVGSIAGYFVGLGLGALFSEIADGLDNEVFTPRSLHFGLTRADLLPDDMDPPDWFEINERGALYRISYDWHLELT